MGIELTPHDPRHNLLANMIAECLDTAMHHGLDVDVACSVTLQVIADYWRLTHKPAEYAGLSDLLDVLMAEPPRGNRVS